MIPRAFWVGLDPDEAEPLSMILAAIHCYQVAPPLGVDYLSPGHYFEFTVADRDHHRIANGFPELQELANFLGHEIPFLNSMASLPSPAGPRAAKLMITPESTQKKEETGPSTLAITTVGAHGRYPTALIVLTTTDSHKSACKYTRSFNENPKLRTMAVLQFALPMQINTEKELQRMAKCSSLSVFTKEVDGKVNTVIHRQPLSTGNGAIQLWLSDLVEEEDVKKLSDEFIRNRNHAPNFTIPYDAVINNIRQCLHIEEVKTEGVAKNPVGHSNIGSGSGGGGGGKRSFSTLAGANVLGLRSLPIKGNTMPLMPPTFFTAPMTTTTTTTTTTTAKHFVHHPRALHTAALRMPAIGRFLGRLGKW
ncbi:hypothetical protein B0T18DRAFT_452640 [Schizothecium vesticola]|uniref:Uncharacterized protein n=1 Tax=Schizothecium vesticola TaxID=314040 RepID=A0AA40F9A9_9PEZI|nr:hypothetical protein B0T18DRAFT_452640 [Schizothecium vesticola]